MGMLAGTGLFLVHHVLNKLPARGKALGIARMKMNWHIDDVIKHLTLNDLKFNQKIADKVRQQNSRYTSKDFFELLGFEDCQDIDFDAAEGCSIIHDLNQPLPVEHENCFDFVMENGTIEHIFDIKIAVGNIAKAVKVGGLVCHVSPLDAFNHGFYNLSINFFNDFYRANGYGDMEFYLMRYAANWWADQNVLIERLPYTHEEFYIHPDMYKTPYNKFYIGFCAKKHEHLRTLNCPTQAAYNRSLGLSSKLNTW